MRGGGPKGSRGQRGEEDALQVERPWLRRKAGTSGSWKILPGVFSPRASRSNTALPTAKISSLRPVSDGYVPELLRSFLCVGLTHQMCGDVSQQQQEMNAAG